MRRRFRLSSVLVHGLLQTAGVALIGAGAWVAHPAAGLIVWGAGVVGLSVAAEISR